MVIPVKSPISRSSQRKRTVTSSSRPSVEASRTRKVTLAPGSQVSSISGTFPAERFSIADGEYLSYDYARNGSPLTLTAPDEPGAYEIRYASDRVEGTFARRPIRVE